MFRLLHRRPPAPSKSDSLRWNVDECSVYFGRLHVVGWCHHAPQPIVRVELVYAEPRTVVPLTRIALPSPDVAAAIGPAASGCRFDDFLTVAAELLGRDFILRFTLKDRTVLESESVHTTVRGHDAFHGCWVHFLNQLRDIGSGTVLEIGSRARSAITYRDLIPVHLEYLGMDILPGPNVDLVGDAHRLEELLGANRFVAAFSLSVFEHLAMPWKVAIELNRVLLPGGIVFTGTHQTWPMHEEPWDFWRFSPHSWQTIFNDATGFQIVETARGEPAQIHPRFAMTSKQSVAGSTGVAGLRVHREKDLRHAALMAGAARDRGAQHVPQRGTGRPTPLNAESDRRIPVSSYLTESRSQPQHE